MTSTVPQITLTRHDRTPKIAIAAQTWFTALLSLTVLIQLVNPGVSDVSWLILVCDKILDGERLYTDFIEVNPPASPLLYLPPVWVARQTGIQAEYIVLLFVVAGLGAALWCAGRLLARNGLVPNAAATAIAATVAFGVIAGNSFAQREHIAAIALLPMLSLIACRMQAGAKISRLEALGAGIAAGIAVSTKPHFAAAILLPQLYVAWSARSLRPLIGIENWVTAAVFVLYILSTFVYFPEFWFDIFPMLLETYRPARLPYWLLISYVAPFIIISAAYIYASGPKTLNARLYIPLLAATGFMVGYFEQGKGWQYHYYPAAALILFAIINDALGFFLEKRFSEEKSVRYGSVKIAATLVLLLVTALRFMPYAQVSASLEPAIREVAGRPRVLAITGDLGISDPLTRRVNGMWVGTFVSQWLTETAYQILQRNPNMPDEQRRRLAMWIEKDREVLNRDIRLRKPDVLLIDRRSQYVDWKEWAYSDPETSRLLSKYKLKEKNKYVELYVRRD